MERHYTYTMDLFPYDLGVELEKFCFAIALGLALLLLGKLAANKISSKEGIKENLIPSKFNLFGFFDLFCEGFIKFHDSFLGKNNRKYFPLSASVFIFIFASNILGLIPGMPAITTTVWVNLGIAFVVFIYFNYHGIKENGLIGYLKHFAGGDDVLSNVRLKPFKAIALSVFMLIVSIGLFGVEILSVLLRVLTLNLRLYWNINADHMVLSIFNDMAGGLFGSVFYGLGTFVSFMQAFIFTVLTMVYILLATQHEEEH